jgi:arylsulfatase A-like enzyme
MDWEIGRLLQTLKDEGIDKDTLVVFVSDNGGSAAFGGSNLPLRGGKADTYEGGIRVPAIMNWPGVLAGGDVSHQRMQVADLYATLESAAGLPNRAPRESFDAWRAIVARKSVPREPLFFMSAPSARGAFETRSRSLLAGDWKLVVVDAEAVGGGTTTELYRITTDPSEQNDLAQEFPHHVLRLRRLVDAREGMLRTEQLGVE